MYGFYDFVLIFFVALATSVLAIRWASKPASQCLLPDNPDSDALSLLFEDGMLHHGNDSALSHLALRPGFHDWNDLRQTMERKFPDIPEKIDTDRDGSLSLLAKDENDQSELQIRWRGPHCWVTLKEREHLGHTKIDRYAYDELRALKRAFDLAPGPIWQTDENNQIIWYNKAYSDLFKLIHDKVPSPSKRLFPVPDPEHINRVALPLKDDAPAEWYEIVSQSVDGISVNFANCINSLVDAENAQRNFVQTLAKTFAHLSTGLAIFDKNSQLALFNPSLVDLTGLPAQFLSARPTITSFFDQLRENRRMPEPKNYMDWRQKIAEVIAKASDGSYQETWSLETGQTYNVQGRPHPDGATVFLIEDISAAVSLTRNFRAEQELGQSLIDHIECGLAVFSATGVLTLCNAAYRNLWGQDPESTFVDMTVTDAISLWREQSIENPVWQEVEELVTTQGDRTALGIPIVLKSGSSISCDVIPIASGATMVRFQTSTSAENPNVRDLIE